MESSHLDVGPPRSQRHCYQHTSFIYPDNGSIINLEQHIDTENRLFFYALGKVAIIFVSKYEHCLYGLLLRNLADYQQL